jgi:hypothetical protein
MSEKTNRYIDPLSEFGFKHLFCNEQHKEILLNFLAAVFEGKKQIADLAYSPAAAGDDPEHRKNNLELLCREQNGKYFTVAIQLVEEQLFRDCTRQFMAGFFKELDKNEADSSGFPFKESYLIGLLNFSFGDCEDLYYREISFTKLDRMKNPTGKLGFKFMELPEFTKTREDLETDMDKWFYLLKHIRHMVNIPEIYRDEVFQKIFKAAEVAALTDEEKALYEAELQKKVKNETFKVYNPGKAADRAAQKEMEEGRLNEEAREAFIEVFRTGYDFGFEEGMLEIASDIGRKL